MPSLPTWLAWSLAVFAVLAGYALHGWLGVLLAFTIIVFWLLMQFNRAMRTLRAVAHAPVGHVASAVMLNAKLRRGMALSEVMALTKSLGSKETNASLGAANDASETFFWQDTGGVSVRATFEQGRLATWALSRAAQPEGDNPVI
jgi:ABC-type protease/lipase transport system fused ATPase/permease subunit